MCDESMRRNEAMLFNLETTSREDYRFGHLKTYKPHTSYKPRKTSLNIQHPPLKDMQTLSDFKCPFIPFSLYHTRKEIIQTDPRTIQKSYKLLEDRERKEVQKTRPRVCIFPELALDDVEEPARQILVNSTYLTSTQLAAQEGMSKTLAKTKNTKAPLSEVYAPANMVKLPRLFKEPVVSPEWRMDSASWDSRQLRVYVDPTKNFWLKQKPACQECKNPQLEWKSKI